MHLFVTCTQISSYLLAFAALQCPLEEKHTDVTKIPWWPVTKYKQTALKIAAASQRSLKCLWKPSEAPSRQPTPDKSHYNQSHKIKAQRAQIETLALTRVRFVAGQHFVWQEIKKKYQMKSSSTLSYWWAGFLYRMVTFTDVIFWEKGKETSWG